MVSGVGHTLGSNRVRGLCGRENTGNNNAEETVIVWMKKFDE